jgi:hypothetical protein
MAFSASTAGGIGLGTNSTSATIGAAASGTSRFGFTGGVFVASGDINGDGFADIIVSADAGTSPQIQVFDGRTGAIIANFFAFSTPYFKGGVRVAAGDVNGDGKADIIVAAGKGGGPQVQVYDGATMSVIANFYAFGVPSFGGGVFVAAGDMNSDGFAEVICGAGGGGGPQVTVYDGVSRNATANFYAYAPTFGGGVRVGARDVNGDKHADILTVAGPGGAPLAEVFDGVSLSLLNSFYAYGPGFAGGVFIG